MKKLMLLFIIMLGVSLMRSDAQYVKKKYSFSISISIGPNGPPPYPDAVWITPEWAWRGGQYVEIPGHWERVRNTRARWVQGQWIRHKKGYCWQGGSWRY